MAGYSGTPLLKKLGVKEGHRVAVIGGGTAESKYFEKLPEGARLMKQARSDMDVVVFFTKSASTMHRRLSGLATALAPAGGLWIAWPKKASGVATDLDFDVVRSAGLALKLVDNKVCAVDETWSGLRFVIPVARRPKKT